MSSKLRPCLIVCPVALLLATSPFCPATAQQASTPGKPLSKPTLNPNLLIGTWKVDLRPTPDAPPYYQYFVVKSVEGGRVTGTFYQSDIQEGRINKDWDTIHFAFTTNDARERGIYNTTGRLVNGRLEGTTHSIGRGFLAVWTAERVTKLAEPQKVKPGKER